MKRWAAGERIVPELPLSAKNEKQDTTKCLGNVVLRLNQNNQKNDWKNKVPDIFALPTVTIQTLPPTHLGTTAHAIECSSIKMFC